MILLLSARRIVDMDKITALLIALALAAAWVAYLFKTII
jgi:hypothetical protein